MGLPCIIITRDRVTYLKQCLSSLEPSGLNIHLVDHGSTWEPMLEFLEQTHYPVHRRGSLPPRALWDWEDLETITGSGLYLVTDPDVVLETKCPDDWLEVLGQTWLDHKVIKVGLGIRHDDLPNESLGIRAKAWEGQYWSAPTANGHWYAPVDTTLAIYSPLSLNCHFALAPAVRLGEPYLIRHLPWYDSLDDEENCYYRDHLVPGSSHWYPQQ